MKLLAKGHHGDIWRDAHDLSLGNYISDTAIILRLGRIVERGKTPEVFDRPSHPHTQMLLESVPALHGGRDLGLWADRLGRCLCHERYPDADAEAPDPDADAEAPASDDNPIMAEIEPGHLVTCANVDEPGGCPGAKTPKAA